MYGSINEFTITPHTTDSQTIAFTGWASAETNKVPDNSFNDNLIGDFILENTGIATMTRYGFKLNEGLISSIRVKISNSIDASNSITLTTENQYPSWCQSQLPGDKCQVWVFMDLDYGNNPQEIINKITVTSEDIL